jgi:hypothetical protein
LAKNTHQSEQMEEAALRNAEKFTIDKVGEKWLDFFETNKQYYAPNSEKPPH